MTSNQQTFLNERIADAIAVGEEFNINPSVILAQAGLEGAYGISFGAKWRKNHFGITAFGSTNKYWDGSKSQSSSSGLWFRIYKNDRDGFSDFARLISTKYASCAKVSYDISKYATCISQSAYISEKNGDNREGYRKGIEANAKLFDPFVKEYVKTLSVKKRNITIALSVSLLIVIVISVIYMIRNKKQ